MKGKEFQPTEIDYIQSGLWIELMNEMQEAIYIEDSRNEFFKRFVDGKINETEEEYYEREYYNTNQLEIIVSEVIKYLDKELAIISRNPIKELAERKIIAIKERVYGNNKRALRAMVYYLKVNLEDILDLGHTFAWIYIDEYYEHLNININKANEIKKTHTFKWLKGDIDRLYNQLISYNLLSKNTSFEEFKNSFSGCEISKANPVQFIANNSSVTYLIEELNKKGFITNVPEIVKKKILNIKQYRQTKNSLKYKDVKKQSEIDTIISVIKAMINN